ncbi:TIGR04219 family outer membrane beta-barrel protein [Sulfurovum sp. zt1-1]|uniref:TIGR04219 family outer membrane beta-barrel protein n=1 Tax=Sulfurovum zhangzhouensis TaxID=3019067 RepID=A0ABT7R0I1_9BACT|nr:TIGR04219 family outer membrane beta-barrel protein [Sulfurovum zhangzhouensis]MDM5272610.1 TIGR04219 family outer membrane beta-barrel protein [Sulfurovum zhangzhouensis]
MVRTLLKTAFLSSLFYIPLNADFIGGELSVGVYSHTPKGYAAYDIYGMESKTSIEDTLHWTESQDLFFKAYLEHPLPVISNIKLEYNDLSHQGSGPVSGFTWGDISDFTGDLSNKLDMHAFDVTLYYELIDNWASLDTGLTLRHVYGDIYVKAGNMFMTQEETIDYDTWIPMIYMKGRFDVPTTDITFQAELNAITFSSSTMYDALFTMRYTAVMGLGIEGGYRMMHLDDNELAAGLALDVDFKGPYAAVVWDF